MKIGREEVEHVAQLSRLALTEPELARMQQDLTEILTDMRTLEELDREKAENVSREVPLCHVTREDAIRPSGDRAALLANAPVHNEDSIIVPKTVE